MPDMPWGEVEPLPLLNGAVQPMLDSVRSLQAAWRQVVLSNDLAFQEARKRSLRRHAIETGIIERLYDVDWGVTLALVAEGITADTVSRTPEGSISEDVLELIRSQYDALEFLAAAVRDGQDVSVSLIKQLHIALTRRQPAYTASGPGGVVFQATLHHGQWKTQPNSVTRPDGSTLEYTPPDQVAPQMERLVELYKQTEEQDPVIRAAWLHHRFVRIHPFEDGNGRVARCLTLLTLLTSDLAPLVVDRRERDNYLRALDFANEGDLRPLVRFFAQLEIVALRSELERPVLAPTEQVAGGALAVLEAGIDRLRLLHGETGAIERATAISALADDVHNRINTWLTGMAEKFQQLLKAGVDVDAHASVMRAAPPDQRARYWRYQAIQTARSVDFFVNLNDGIWWNRLRITARGQELRYLVFVQKVGHGETGVLAMTVYAESVESSAEADASPEVEPLVISAPTETVTWTYTDTSDHQWNAVVEVLDATLASALQKFTFGLS
jgi:Fic family protein